MPIELNRANYEAVLNKIESCPAEWNQRSWHCGTTHCFAGWAQVLSGRPASDATVRRDARQFLGLTSQQSDYLFSAYRKLADFREFLVSEFDAAGYDRDGYDCAGYNRAGYNRDGYDRDGLDANNQPLPEVVS
jgi:hypothetical protein